LDEHGFIRYIHSKLDPKLVRWKIHDTFAGGVPDAYYLGEKGPLWVEYKYIKALPKKETTAISTCLTLGQRLWLDDLHRCKQPCALIIGHEQRAVILTNGKWNESIYKRFFVTSTVSRVGVADWIKQQCM
jgi:hypothetical protein